MTTTRVSILFLVVGVQAAFAVTDPAALRICRGTGGLLNVCLPVILNARFESAAIAVCSDLTWPSARIRCLQIVANTTIEPEVLRACEENRGHSGAAQTDWPLIDCLKAASEKTSAELNFQIRANPKRGAEVWDHYTREEAWREITRRMDRAQRQGYCRGYRYLIAERADWKTASCWSTRFAYDDVHPNPPFLVGEAPYNHCRVFYRCLTE